MPFPWVTLRFCFKTSPEVVWKLSVEHEFDLHKNEPSLGGHIFIWAMSHNLSFGSFTANAFSYIVNCLSIASAFSVNTYSDHSSQNDFLMLLTLGWCQKKPSFMTKSRVRRKRIQFNWLTSLTEARLRSNCGEPIRLLKSRLNYPVNRETCKVHKLPISFKELNKQTNKQNNKWINK